MNGLAGISLDGMWTLTGTMGQGAYTGVGCEPQGTSMPVTETVWMERTGTGWCHFAFSTAGPITDMPGFYVDDTAGGDYREWSMPHQGSTGWSVCVDAGDMQLTYRYFNGTSMPNICMYIDGKLTR